ncbi:hypothetical protein ATANTOWER_019023 [Ataeniobius toweri]|uniref:Uncharacterized protein n=1 Tax=Ataeniobius toweri TaxID=208326 RepID=A0ABU7CI07_9TELE|nr:hypothetical protein [Ataeniobius toweri]
MAPSTDEDGGHWGLGSGRLGRGQVEARAQASPDQVQGLSLQLPGASALWLLGGSPGTLPCSSLGGCSSPGSGSPGVPVLWGSFGCLWLRSPPYLSRVQVARSVAPHTRYCIFLWRNCVYTSALTLRPTGV